MYIYIYILDCYRDIHAHVWQLYGDDYNDPEKLRHGDPFCSSVPN